MSSSRNFVEHLQQLAAGRPDDTALVIVGAVDGLAVDTPITYAALARRVRALATRLQRRFAPGARVLVLLDNDDRYVVSFLACLHAGLIAVPAFPPESARPQHLARLAGIAHDAQPAALLATRATLALIGAGFADAEPIALDEFDAADDAALAAAWQPHAPRDGDIAFLQYTSGSTSTPKGVMVSHGNLMANERAIGDGFEVGAGDVFVSWLPLYHDMGLIGGLLQPLHRGVPAVLMTPQFFLERPVRWLEAIARHRGSISGAPDFAYRLCVERVKEGAIAALDLSSWRVAFSGAEPVRHDTLRAFVERFAPARFDARSLFPCYGLAEATLFVSGATRGQGLRAQAFSAAALAQGRAQDGAGDDAVTLVSSGRVPAGQRVELVDPQTLAACADGQVGEIWAAGPNIAQGYWQRLAETQATFVERGGQRWLRTGDLGFLRDGELHVTGRLKDLIILRGQNVYPQDIERAIEAEVDAVRAGRVAAFAVDLPGGGEGIGIAVEVSRATRKRVPAAALVQALNDACADACREAVSVALLLNPGALPKTSSGKLQRRACRQGFEQGTLDAFAVFAHGRFVRGGSPAGDTPATPLDATEEAVAALWQEVLGHAALPPRDAQFFASGGNSLGAVQLAARIAERWGIAFAPRDVFAQPRLVDLAARVRQACEAGASSWTPIPVLDAVRRTEPLPLSHAQQRQWFLWQLDPASSAYHVRFGLQWRGLVDAAALQASLDTLAARHEPLRTQFQPADDGTPRQHIQPSMPVVLQPFDLRGRPDGDRQAVLQRLLDTPFDLRRGPLWRVGLLRVRDDAQQLVVVMHHIVSDGASMQVFADELAAGYAARLAGRPLPLAAPAVQYADHALWQRDQLAAGEAARQLAWWRAELAHDGAEEPVLALATDHPRRPQAGYRAARHAVTLPGPLRAALQSVAHGQGATLSMLLLGVFQGLLYRCTGQRDVRVGMPVANRARPESQALIGLFVNTLVLRSRVDGRTTLAQLVAQARDASLGAQAHAELPFDSLVEALQPERSPGASPLFQVMFNHVAEDPRGLRQWPGLDVESLPLPELATQFELVLEVRERAGDPLVLSFVYAAELFEQPTVARFGAQLLALLTALAQRPAQALGDVPLLGADDRARLEAWGVDPQRFDDWQPVHRSFEQRVRDHPSAVALHVADTTLDRAGLNRRANRLAHRLIASGIGPQTRVGIALERSVAMMVGILAVLKAGAAYVPLDTGLPAERLAWMAADSGVALVLAQRAVRERLPAMVAPVLDLDTVDLATEPDHDPQLPVHAEQLAYVIYTSGSTGTPKGAAVRHRALASCMAWMQQAYRLDASDTVLHKAAFGFDVSAWEMFWPLTTGTPLVLAEPGEHRDPARLAALILRHRITTLNFVPAMLQAFLQQPQVQAMGTQAPLRRVIVGGEALPAEAQKEVALRLPRATLYNLYGPTETTIHVTHWTCRADGAAVPIGRPISDTSARVLDADLNLVPPGVPGELYLGGVSLARGYLNRAALTAERFVADPFDPHGGRLYRTGDLVRWNHEGQLDYLGRIDQQVKVRGVRIELGEVEARLLAQPAVRDAVVVARPGPAGLRLVAYAAPQAGRRIDAAALRQALAELLPDPMVPSAIVAMDALPLTPNGKVDRRALPEPVFDGERAHVAPQGRVAEALAGIWREVLGVARVGLHDNFFDLGGQSLLLIRVHRLVQQRLDPSVPLIELFKHPTLVALAQRLERGAAVPAGTAVDDRARQQRAALLQRRRPTERNP
ncbi:non-ribosomal peptide synthetase [Rhizobacter sp. Root16D2]|uniref:non-ribosomal peptide synthetase n=1 Tax=Rhizobacter sp. Root16D2 TaxID=1736479 RepID=UPI0006FC36A7|nr:non-ribosomal peptide synthetase [Rhizobacter sp. Root16D2]KRB18908.1 non-ribosomal peptide synthetase [Rhizobacter sp. Root16D2]